MIKSDIVVSGLKALWFAGERRFRPLGLEQRNGPGSEQEYHARVKRSWSIGALVSACLEQDGVLVNHPRWVER